ncbi:PaaI family thioesterase [Marinactinospora rubrisoli]|uniref:PaaI family thioesterase n=1 Tax=Marinactinospora rubrisoli TaxID=2715399 RepID=A0ABW2KG18_9ACTN
MALDTDQLTEIMGDPAFAGALGTRMGLEVLEASVERVVGRIPVEGNTQPYGLLHGGASCVLAETLGSVGSAIHAGLDRIAVGIELNATHHRAATEGFVTGTATPVHLGRSLATWEIVITDDAGRRVCTARLTCMLRDAPKRA